MWPSSIPPVIIELGTAFVKVGFAGDAAPRHFVESKELHSLTLQWPPPTAAEWQSFTSHLLARIYFDVLRSKPTKTSAVLCYNATTPTPLREACAFSLFEHLKVPKVAFVKSGVAALYTTGLLTGVVIDCGYSETRILPFYCGYPLIQAEKIIRIGVIDVHNALNAGIKHPDKVATEIIEDMTSRCCFIRGGVWEDLGDVTFTIPSSSNTSLLSSVGIIGSSAETIVPSNEKKVELKCNKTTVVTRLTIPSSLRTSAAEVLFEKAQDSDGKTIASSFLDAVLACPLDVRSVVIQNVLLVGGATEIQGFQERLRDSILEIASAEIENEKENSPVASFTAARCVLEGMNFHKSKFPGNAVVWTGCSLLADSLEDDDRFNAMEDARAEITDLFFSYEDYRKGLMQNEDSVHSPTC
eukprot:g1282.t1